MIFKQIEEILNGKKTQTRRVVKDCETLLLEVDNRTTVYTNNRIKWQVGRTYAVVPKRGAATYIHNGNPTRIRITNIRKEPLQEITLKDARAEGIWLDGDCWHTSVMPARMIWSDPRSAYQNLWKAINKTRGARWEDNPTVFVIDFELVEEQQS